MSHLIQKARFLFHSFLADQRGELDEKALLITFFVLVAMIGLGALGIAISGQFSNLAGLI